MQSGSVATSAGPYDAAAMTPEVEQFREALDGLRAGVLRKLAGLGEEDARRSTVGSDTNVAGLVQLTRRGSPAPHPRSPAGREEQVHAPAVPRDCGPRVGGDPAVQFGRGPLELPRLPGSRSASRRGERDGVGAQLGLAVPGSVRPHLVTSE